MTSRPYAEVIGDPINHSKSPLIHRFWLHKLRIDADYRATRVSADTLVDYLEERRGDPAWRGCNVTMPLKVEVLPHVAQLSEDAQRARAANVLLRIDDGRLSGFNSDVEGVAQPLAAALASADRHETVVQIIGAGGAAPAALIGASRVGLRTFQLFVRDPRRGQELALRVGAEGANAYPLDQLGPARIAAHSRSFVVINATPMGMTGQPEVPIVLADYPADTLIFEMVYDPRETGLVRQARDEGMLVIDGLQMLVAQAAAAFEYFFGQPAPREHDAELRALLTT